MDAGKRHPLMKAVEVPLAPAPIMPVELGYIWTWFLKLSRKRQNGMGANPIASTEVLAWAARQGVLMTPFENDVIDRLDELYLAKQYEKEEG